MTISRFNRLYDPAARADDILWPDLFREFSKKVPFLGGDSHPGWSPAEFEPPHRALENVRHIHALCLDYDNKTPSGDRVETPITIEAVAEALADFYALIHTTRHHTNEWPRFRVILPLTRPINKMEYSVVWQVAARTWPGVDPQPKDPSRFWYTPGVADHPGAEFEAVTVKGAYLNPDEFVEQQRSIIVAPSEPAAPAKDPLLETRARAYIERMPPAISGAGGHSALWNVTRKLICDFGLDEQSAFRILSTEYNSRCQPPWSEKDLRHKVRDAVTKARVTNPIQDRDVVTPPGGTGPLYNGAPPGTVAIPTGDDWRKYLRFNQNNQMTKDVGNVALIMKNEPGFRGTLMYDAMAYRIFWYIKPSYKVGIEAPEAGSDLEDHHATYVAQVLAKNHGLTVGKDLIWAAMEAAAHENKIHPVQDYLQSLQWDGVPRLSRVLHNYYACEDTAYNAAVGRWFMISAVARAYRPGCQADHVLILEGKQGYGKSQGIKALGDPWVLGSLPDIRDGSKAIESIGGHWLVEIAELDAFKGAGMTRIKDFVTLQTDVYRPPYARATLKRPRSCVFIGTTNESNYLSDPTGARRFWPVRVIGKIDRNKIEADRDQLWAEAKAAFNAGEHWYPSDFKMMATIAEEQEDRYSEDEWSALVTQWIKARGADETGFTIDEILSGPLNMPPDRWDRQSQTRVGAILTKLGYYRKRVRVDGSRAYRYFPAGAETGTLGDHHGGGSPVRADG